MLLSSVLTGLALLSSLCSTPTALKIQVYKDNELQKTYSRPSAEFNGQSYNIPKDERKGILVYPHPKNACQPVQPAPDLNDTYVFAYIDEYLNCPGYSESYLEDAHYDAMIAYSRMKSSNLDSSANIPRALVDSSEFATYLKDNAITNDTSDLNPNTTIYVVIQDNSLDLQTLFIVFGMILLSALFISILIFCCSICWRILVMKWRNRGLTRWQVRRLPKRKWRRAKNGACETCSICLEEFKEGESVRVLPCDHVFHPKCVDVWLQKWNRTCPLCKSAIKRKGKPLFTEDPESSRLITDSGAPSQEAGSDERDSPGGSAHGTTNRGASNYGAMEHTSPLRSMAAERHRRNASSTSSSSQRSASRHTRTGSKHDMTVTTAIELNVTSSGETSRSVSHSPSPSSSLLHFHTPHDSDDGGGGGGDGDISEATPSFKTANGENSITSSVRV